MHQAMLGEKIVYRLVLSGPIIPNGHGTRLPRQPYGMLLSNDVSIQKRQQSVTLFSGQANNLGGKKSINVNSLTPQAPAITGYVTNRQTVDNIT